MKHRLTRRFFLLGLVLACRPWQALAEQAAGADMVLAIGGGTPLGPGDGPGFASSIAIEAFRRIGIKAEVIVLPAERALINANAGIEDGDVLRGRGVEANYRDLVRVPQSIMPFEVGAYTFDPDLRIDAISDLDDRTIGIETDVKLLERAFADHARLTAVADLKQLFTLLANRRVEVALAERWQGNWWAKRLGLDCRVLLMPLPREPMFIYLHKRHAALVPDLAAAIGEMKADGTHARFFLKILAPPENI